MNYTYHFINLSHKYSHFWILLQKIFCFLPSLTLRITEQTAKAIVLENNPITSRTSLSLPSIFRDIDFNNCSRKHFEIVALKRGCHTFEALCMHFPNCLPIPHSHTVITNIIASNLAVILDSYFSFTPKSHWLPSLLLRWKYIPTHNRQVHGSAVMPLETGICSEKRQKKCEESHFGKHTMIFVGLE